MARLLCPAQGLLMMRQADESYHDEVHQTCLQIIFHTSTEEGRLCRPWRKRQPTIWTW